MDTVCVRRVSKTSHVHECVGRFHAERFSADAPDGRPPRGTLAARSPIALAVRRPDPDAAQRSEIAAFKIASNAAEQVAQTSLGDAHVHASITIFAGSGRLYNYIAHDFAKQPHFLAARCRSCSHAAGARGRPSCNGRGGANAD